MNKTVFSSPVKNLEQIRLVVFQRNAKSTHFNSKNYVTELKTIGYFNN